MPARKPSKRRLLRRNKEHKQGFKFPKKIFTALLIIAAFFIFTIVTTRHWDGVHNLVLAVDNGDDVSVLVFNTIGKSETRIDIPGSTEVDVARQLGKWRLKNVEKLGENENISGELISETVTKDIKLPVYLWAESPALGFYEGGLTEGLGAVFLPYKSSLGFGDRLRLFYFSLQIKNYKKEVVNLANTRYLKEATITDGGLGYEIVGNVPGNIVALFSDPTLSESMGRAKIIDKTEDRLGKKVGEILEVMGLKVIAVTAENTEEINCRVGGTLTRVVESVSKLFSCEKMENNELDVVLEIGEKFARKF